MADYYKLLGINKDASDKEIKSAYKKAARKYHPDNSETGDEATFKQIGEAYEVLKDPQKKTIYDQYGEEGLKGASGANGFGGFGGGAGFDDISDIFSSFFGEGMGGFSGRPSTNQQNRPRRGRDHEINIKIDFMDALEGKTKKLRVNPLKVCKSCDGKGAENPNDVKTCSTCNGTGQVTSLQNTLFGQVRQVTTCPTCNGTGKEIKNPCKSCNGKGYKRYESEVEVQIPAGVENGMTMRLKGYGDCGTNGGPDGDIYLHININPHHKFKREGADIFTEINIGITEASLGDEFEIDTVRGPKKIKIKAGTQSGDVITIRDAGMPELNRPSRFGSHHVQVNVTIPTNLSGKEKDLLKELRELRNKKDVKL